MDELRSRRHRSRAATATVAIALLAACALPAAAPAGKTQISIFQDDQALVLSGPLARERALDDLALLGVDTVHSIVFWNRVAPDAGSTKRPAGFSGSDPATYPAELWDRYDGLVRGARARGMDLILTPSSPLPAWASRCSGGIQTRRTCRPDPTQYKRFVAALGRRYSGEYSDENEGRGVLPRVTRWSIWNEPNQGGWLTPQYTKINGRARRVSPALYRELVKGAVRGLRETGHGSDDMMLGETAPIGRKSGLPYTRPMPPGDFLRGLFCLDERGGALHGEEAALLRCNPFGSRLDVNAISHHPYTRGGSRPPRSASQPNEITISSIGRLKTILSQAARHRRIRFGLPLFYTEFGYQSNPPDRLSGVSLSQQARYLNESDWIAYGDSRVKAVAQYELRDEPNLASFQTGLRFSDGRLKPAFDAYRLPIWVTRAGSQLRVFGLLRPAPDDAREVVQIQNDASAGGSFETVAEIRTTSRKGYFVTSVPRRSGFWRLSWAPSEGGPALLSRVTSVASR